MRWNAEEQLNRSSAVKHTYYGVLFVSKFITGRYLENTVGIYKSSGHLCKSQWVELQKTFRDAGDL